jgi:hypothetical protein
MEPQMRDRTTRGQQAMRRHSRRSRGLGWTVAAILVVLAGPLPGASAKKFQVVVFGDSYGSGEGAPAVVGNYGSDGADLRGQGISGREGRAFPSPGADWNGNSADQAFTGDDVTDARRCHRSPKATAPRAVRLLAAEFPDIDFTFRSFACSGARIDEGVTSSYEGAQPSDESDRLPPQISQANDYLDAPPEGTDKRIDALVMNIGGNNLGFANIIQRCLNLPPYSFERCSPPTAENRAGNFDTLRVLQTGVGSGEPVQMIGLDNLPDLYEELNKKINRLPDTAGKLAVKPARIYLTTPTNPAAGGRDGCFTGQYDYEKNLGVDDQTWLRDTIFPTLVEAMRVAAQTHLWRLVELGPAAPANGLCSGPGRMFNRNRDALLRQGATVVSDGGLGVSHGIAHPNSAGYAAMAPILASELRPQVIQTFTPGVPAADSARPAPVVALADRVQLRLADPPEDYLTYPVGSTSSGDLAAGPLGMGVGTVDVPVPTTGNTMGLFAQRCGPLSPAVARPVGCSPSLLVADVLNGTPGVPTGVTVEGTRHGVDVRWTKGSAVHRTLRRFLITATSSIKTEGLLGERDVTNEFTVAPELRAIVLPLAAGDWKVSVRECTDRGCAAGSTPLAVHSTGATEFDPRDLLGPELVSQQQFSPVGVFAIPAGSKPRAGARFPLRVSWGVWRQWKDLRRLRVRLVGERGELATIVVTLGSGRVTVSGPGSRARHGRIGSGKTLSASALTLNPGKSRIVGGGPRGRLVALELPLRLSKALRPQRVDVEIDASSRGGKRQSAQPAGSFLVTR